jgi:aryl-alcohol dehydrogenase-like predicted oxidoreductase
MNERLALGTVQIGQPYGVANLSGQIGLDESRAILAHAESAGLDLLDTAVAYGESERRLGEIGVGHWRVVSKLPAVPQDCPDISSWVEESVVGSLERLGVTALYGLLLHSPQQLLDSQGDEIYRALVALKDLGIVQNIGVSVYGPDELEALVPHFKMDLVQAPFNVIDRRLATSGWLARLHNAGIEVHVRSVFLQGLLLMEADHRPEQFDKWQPLWATWHRWLKEHALEPLQACLGFVLSHSEIDQVLVGVDSLAQMKAILANTGATAEMPPQSLMSDDPNLINPSRWIQR